MPRRRPFARRPPDSFRRGYRRPRECYSIDWAAVAEREGWSEPGVVRARRTDADVAGELRCSRSLVSRRRRRYGVLCFKDDVGRRPPVDALFDDATELRLADVIAAAGGSRSRARRWLRELVDAGVLVAVGTDRNRRWCLSTLAVDLEVDEE